MRYIALELDIPYDNDDFDLWKSNFYDTKDKCIVVDNYGHGSGPTITEYIDYKKAMLLFYEQNNISAFKQIFIDQFLFAVKTYF